jgi:iron complex transport system substrate-binding protein
MQDVTYTELIILEYRDRTELADAKYDGDIDILDMTQIALIILGREKELTFADALGEAVTVDKPVERIICGYTDKAETLQMLDVTDKVVGVDEYVRERISIFPELSKLPEVTSFSSSRQNYEAMLNLMPDVYIPYMSTSCIETKRLYEEKLPGVAIIFLELGYQTKTEENFIESFINDIKKLGYILDKENEAEEFCEWYEGYMNMINDRTKGLSDDEKPSVYVSFWRFQNCVTREGIVGIAGGRNIGSDLGTGHHVEVSPEWLMVQNPDFIIRNTVWSTGYELDELSGETDPDSPSYQLTPPLMAEDVLNKPELACVNAVTSRRVYVIEHTHLTTGPGHILGAVYYAKLFQPDLFEDLDPEEVHQEYLDRFMRIDYYLNEHGIFVYPPLKVNGGLAGVPDSYEGLLDIPDPYAV